MCALGLGIGKDSANDVGADDDDDDDDAMGRMAVANINNICFVGGLLRNDCGGRRFIQQTQKMGEKCVERANQHCFAPQQHFLEGYSVSFCLLHACFLLLLLTASPFPSPTA